MLQGSNVGDNDCKGFDERILYWFSWHDIVPFEPSERLAQHGHAGQLAAVIADNDPWQPHFHPRADGSQAHEQLSTELCSLTVQCGGGMLRT
jgi:hypothetical protein